MADSPKETSKDTPVAEGAPPVSRGIYAAGYSLRDGLIWGLLATVGSYAVLAIGRKPAIKEADKIIQEGNFVDKAATMLENGHKGFKSWMGNRVAGLAKLFGKEIDKEHATGSAITATALIAGGLAGHLAQVPAAHHGWKKAKEINENYSIMTAENTKLKESNTLLAEDVARLNEALAKVKRPDPTAEKDTSASRNA
jgi:hypothetical protein